MRLASLGTLTSLFVMTALVACSNSNEKVGASEHAAVSDVDHMIRRADGTFDVYCADGTVERNVAAAKITANDVCHGGSPDAGPAPAMCPHAPTDGPAPIDFTAPTAWHPPPAAAAVGTSCTPADIQLLQNQADTGADFTALEAALHAQNATCAQCVFTTNQDANWGPIVYTDNKGGAMINWAACFARTTGGSDACGAAFDGTHSCASYVCSSCDTQDVYGICYGAAFADATTCGQYDVNTACGANYAAIDQACMSPWEVITSVCGGK